MAEGTIALPGGITLATQFVMAAAILVGGVIFAIVLGEIFKRLLLAVNVDTTVEGTAFERTARNLNTSTIEIVARLLRWFVYGITAVVVLRVLRLLQTDLLWRAIATYLPQLFFASIVLIVGVILADKVEILVSDRFRGVKLPTFGVIPTLAKYSIIFIAVLIALAQLGVSIGALLIILVIYGISLVVFIAVGCRDLLPSMVAGIYILLNQPYEIGDEIAANGHRGIVQEIDLFVTHVENQQSEYVIPNHILFKQGIQKQR